MEECTSRKTRVCIETTDTRLEEKNLSMVRSNLITGRVVGIKIN